MTHRILITGGAGFAGHHLVEHLLETMPDSELVVLDGLTYAGDVQRMTDCAGYDPERVTVLWHDLRSPIPPTLDHRIGPINAVLHLAANSHVERSIHDPAPFIMANTAITVNLMEWCRGRDGIEWLDCPLEIVVQISTDEVYGPAPDGYSHVEWDPIVPSNPYSASKAAQEAVAISYWRTYGVPVVITNTMNIFGERQSPEKFVPMIVKRLLAGDPVTVHAQRIDLADLPETRRAALLSVQAEGRTQLPVREIAPGDSLSGPADYTLYHRNGAWWRPGSRIWLHARNHADALRWLIDGSYGEPNAYEHGHLRPTRFNVAGQIEVDNMAMVLRIADILDVDAQVQMVDFHSTRPGHDLRYSLDGSALNRCGWTPPVSFDEALARTVKWMVDRPEWLNEA